MYVTALVMVLFDIADGVRFIKDVDDQLRELQIRFLMSAQGHWFDMTLPFISMPEPYVSPWSRMIDLPYVLIALLLQPFLPVDQAISVAFQIWPPMLLSIFCLLVVAAVRRLVADLPLSKLAYAVCLMLMTVVMSMGVLEFSPGRIDHHNVQIIAMMMVIGGLIRWDRVGGMMIGAGSAFSTVIGLECLPFVAIAYAGLVVCQIARVQETGKIILWSSLSILVVTVFSSLAFTGPVAALSTQCDSFSAPYIFLLCGFAVILSACVLLQNERTGVFARTVGLALPGIVLLGAAAFLFPSCLSGPYSIIDPISHELWFDRIWQEKSIRYFYQNGQYDMVSMLGMTLLAAIVVAQFVIGKARSGSYGIAIAYLVALGALLLTVFVTRNIRFPLALMPIFLPPAIAVLLNSTRLTRAHRATVAGGIALLVSLGGLAILFPAHQRDFDAVDYMAGLDCDGQDFSVLSTVSPGRIAVPEGLGLPVLFAAPASLSVAAVPFHRASPGMRRMYQAFLMSDPDLRRTALAPFDYVAICQFPLVDISDKTSLYAALASGDRWPGLEPVQPPVKTAFQLYRIDHAKLQ